MGEWGFLGGLFDSLQAHSPMLGRFWLFLMLVFRILILGTVATDLFDDEQEEFACNTLQPGCKQVCYDQAFPISLYRFWVFHIVLISTPALLFLLYAMHQLSKKRTTSSCSSSDGISYSASGSVEDREARRLRQIYLVNVAFRLLAEVGVLLGQWLLYGFRVEAQFPCSRFPCPYTVDCFTSRPAEKSIFLVFYFSVGVVSGVSSLVELLYAAAKWFCPRRPAAAAGRRHPHHHQDLPGYEEEMRKMAPGRGRAQSEGALSGVRAKAGPVRSSGARKTSGVGHKSLKNPNARPYVV